VGDDCYQWGNQKVYCGAGAYEKAVAQGEAIRATGWKEAEFEAPYQPDQTMQDYSVSELTTSSAISGYQPYKYSASHGAESEEFEAEDNYEATYGKRQAAIRRRLKKKIKAQNVRGTAAGEWSARKSQLLKEKYEAACERANIRPYKGKKTQSQKNLSKWSKQDWRTASGRKSSVTGEPYFPAKAVEALKKKGLYAKARRQKRAATKAGKQNARYSDDIRKVVKRFRAEDDAPEFWQVIETEEGSALYRKIIDLTYNQVWRLLELIDDLNRMTKHHALTKFGANEVEIWVYTHDKNSITAKDYHWTEDFNEMFETVEWKNFKSEERGCYDCPECGHELTKFNSSGWGDYCYCFICEEHFITKPLAMIAAAESRPDWEDIDWKTDKPPAKENEDWGDDVEWDAENKEVALKEFDETDLAKGRNVDDHLAWQLKEYSKINEEGNIGCPECGSVDLFAREFTDKGVKWNCWDCMYSRKIETLKSQKDITLEKFGLVFPCAKCGKDIKAFNRYSLIQHQRKCEGKK